MSTSIATTLKWILLQERFTEVMAGRSVNVLKEPDRNEIYYQLKSGWGLNTSGYKQIGHPEARTPTPTTLSLTGQALSTKWGRPETFVFSRTLPDNQSADPRFHSYAVHVHQPLPLDEPYNAVVTLVVIRHKIEQPGNRRKSPPLYDPALGLQVEQPTWYTTHGEILWSTPTKDAGDFQAALETADQWLRDRDYCDAFVGLNLALAGR
jgi:hypothetical protein